MDVDKLKAILAALEGTDVTRLTWVSGQETLDVRLGHPPAATTVHAAPLPAVVHAPPPAAAVPVPPAAPAAPTAAAPPLAKPAADAKTFTVNSPFVGTFYRSASPENPPFVDVGTVVKKGQVLCIVEAMKLMNEIEADQPGRLVEVLIQNGSPVEYGEALFRFEPA
ncbi:MAG: acetyl-CoA carboxylase biotin carboxyl carrier protein [Deltaproteobacteria bacterium]